MPTSDKEGKHISRLLIEDADPSVVWDIGPGEGTYYDLMKYSTLDAYWVGVEIWEPYVEKYSLDRKYDLVLRKDVREVNFPTQPSEYKLIIFGDVLEHMPEDDARKLIVRAKQHFRWILVSLPIVHAPQGEVNGNPYEAHLKHWTFDEMHEAMGKCMAFKGHTLGLYWWDREEHI